MGKVVLATYEKHYNGGIIDYYEIYAEGSGNTALQMSETGWTDSTNGTGKSFGVTHFSNQGGAYPHLFVSFNESVQIYQTVTRNTTMEPYTSRISIHDFNQLSGGVYSYAYGYWEYNGIKAPTVGLSINFIQSNPYNLELNPLIKVCETIQEYVEWVSTYNPPITYNWQSVPSISGKNGILNLSQIASASINNGESITGASASAFTSLTAQVSTMVTDDSAMSGADAGGISGSGSNSGNQSSGYAFGQGESGTSKSGGGGGLYGGYKSNV